MKTSVTFRDFVVDQLGGVPQLRCRAMFGCSGLYARGQFFGIIHDGRLYFRTTDTTRPVYVAHGMEPFHYNGKQTLWSYYEVPADVLEDAERLTAWAEAAADRRE